MEGFKLNAQLSIFCGFLDMHPRWLSSADIVFYSTIWEGVKMYSEIRTIPVKHIQTPRKAA